MPLAKAKCFRMCWDGSRLYYPHLKDTATKQEIIYEIDPASDISVHFEFSDPDAQKIRNAKELNLKKISLEKELGIATRTLADEKIEKENELAKINQALKDTPNAIKAAARVGS